MGLDVYMVGAGHILPNVDSECHPDHLFKKTYLRSSYNDDGFDRVVCSLIGMTLSSVFNPGDDYEFTPDWDSAVRKAKELLSKLQDRASKLPYKVSFTRAVDLRPEDGEIKSEKDALDWFEKELGEKHPLCGSYSNAKGEFYLDEPLPVSALIAGTSFTGRPGLFVVYKADLSWYVQAAEVLVEFCEYGKQMSASLHWSG